MKLNLVFWLSHRFMGFAPMCNSYPWKHDCTAFMTQVSSTCSHGSLARAYWKKHASTIWVWVNVSVRGLFTLKRLHHRWRIEGDFRHVTESMYDVLKSMYDALKSMYDVLKSMYDVLNTCAPCLSHLKRHWEGHFETRCSRRSETYTVAFVTAWIRISWFPVRIIRIIGRSSW